MISCFMIVSFFLNFVACTRIALEQICFQQGKLTVDCGQMNYRSIYLRPPWMDLISVQCLGALFVWPCFELRPTKLRREQCRPFLDFLIRILQSLVNSFLSWGGFIGFHIWGSLISPSLACLLTVGVWISWSDKRGVGKGTMAAEISARATFLVYFIAWRVNRIWANYHETTNCRVLY